MHNTKELTKNNGSQKNSKRLKNWSKIKILLMKYGIFYTLQHVCNTHFLLTGNIKIVLKRNSNLWRPKTKSCQKILNTIFETEFFRP